MNVRIDITVFMVRLVVLYLSFYTLDIVLTQVRLPAERRLIPITNAVFVLSTPYLFATKCPLNLKVLPYRL